MAALADFRDWILTAQRCHARTNAGRGSHGIGELTTRGTSSYVGSCCQREYCQREYSYQAYLLSLDAYSSVDRAAKVRIGNVPEIVSRVSAFVGEFAH